MTVASRIRSTRVARLSPADLGGGRLGIAHLGGEGRRHGADERDDDHHDRDTAQPEAPTRSPPLLRLAHDGRRNRLEERPDEIGRVDVERRGADDALDGLAELAARPRVAATFDDVELDVGAVRAVERAKDHLFAHVLVGRALAAVLLGPVPRGRRVALAVEVGGHARRRGGGAVAAQHRPQRVGVDAAVEQQDRVGRAVERQHRHGSTGVAAVRELQPGHRCDGGEAAAHLAGDEGAHEATHRQAGRVDRAIRRCRAPR